MKTQHLNLQDGIVEIHENALIVSDKAKQSRTIEILFFISSLFYAIPTAIKGFNDKDYFFFVFGLLLAGFLLNDIAHQLKNGVIANRIYVSKIPFETIACITFESNRFGYVVIGKILLKDKKYREIRSNDRDLQESNFIEALINRGIEVSYS
jgi:hypothetical protein